MKHDYDPHHLNIDAFARAQGLVQGSEPLAHFDRLLAVAQGTAEPTPVRYQAKGEVRATAGSGEQVWLSLSGEVALPQICQRCLGPAAVLVQFEREFRFVASEEQAAMEDEESEEDVLVLARDFNLLELVEDELLMALPVVPKHDVCPSPVKLQVADADFVAEEEQKPNPFSVLEQLKTKH